MSQVFIIVRAAHMDAGELSFFHTEKAFSTKEKADAYMKTVPQVWQEQIGDFFCNCERAVHTVIIDE